MPPRRALRRNILLPALCAGLLAPGGAGAQTPPNAGSILREIESSLPSPLREPPRPLIEDPVRPAMTAPAGASFQVSGFRILRSKVYSEAQLLPLLKDFVGRELTLADLNRAADVLTRHYRERGHLGVRAYVPAQDAKNGIFEIIVLESDAYSQPL